MLIKKLKGFRDILPEESALWRQIEGAAVEVFRRYGYRELRMPLLEETGLFRRSIGEQTDIVEKEMYTFLDGGGTSVTLRPEGTASAVRAFLENGLHRTESKARLYYVGPMFRRERPQKGRLRQFHQLGAECFGWPEAGADADLLCLLWDLFDTLGLSTRVQLQINTLGCRGDRAAYVERLRAYLEPCRDELCENCRRRVDHNPLRVLDCKSTHCQEASAGAPTLLAGVCGDCGDHFAQVRSLLDRQQVPYQVNPRMVRGLDYYNRTTFELLSGDLGAQNAVAAGGRYDGLVETLGGPAVPALGFAAGLERMVLMLAEGNAATAATPLAFLVHRGEHALETALLLRRQLIRAGIEADMDYGERSFKAQMRSANRAGARYALILGEEEVAQGNVAVKNLDDGTQETVAQDGVASILAATGSPANEEE
ncbi:MAG TPA: histidine--tRNA ligase [Deferrisomatales bacterium]|nr:histidine--tRNA ligase [Deferrisomatales bacterium]